MSSLPIQNPATSLPIMPVDGAFDPCPDIPAELKRLDRWGVYKLVWNEDKQKYDKPPYNARTHRKRNPKERADRCDYRTACLALAADPEYSGLGYGIDKVDGLTFVDFDHVVDKDTGVIEPRVQKILDETQSFAEFSVSGTGIHVIARYQIPVDPTKPDVQGMKVGNAEMYSGKHYFALTGKRVPGTPATIETRDLSGLYALIKGGAFLKRAKETKSTETTSAESALKKESVQIKYTGTLIGGTKLDVLMHGEITSSKPFVVAYMGASVEYTSQSEADLALCTLLAIEFERDSEKIDEEFRKSVLFRDKWERADYRNKTIATACVSAAEALAKDEPGSDMGSHERAEGAKSAKSTKSTKSTEPFVYVDGNAFMAEKIPPRKVFLRAISSKEAVFFEQSINQIFAWRGLGKTCLGFGLAKALATGEGFLDWESPEGERRRVLYFEGELPQTQVQERWRQIIGTTPQGYATLITLDKQPDHVFPSFASQTGMDRVEATLAKMEADGLKPDVIFFDSISTLFNIQANEEENWIRIQSWFISLRSRGYCIFFMPHAGKSGLSRSHSKSEDMLDVSIKLGFPKEQELGCVHAVLHYDKARSGLSAADAEIKMRRSHSPDCACQHKMVVGCPGNSVVWEHREVGRNRDAAFAMFEAGASVSDVALALKAPRGTVGDWRRFWGKRREKAEKEEKAVL
ncbi:MAG: AAA family ATPase [Candidatus Acidiferrales bacterium]